MPRSAILLVPICLLTACGGGDESARARPEWRLVKGADGQEYRVVDKPPYTLWYDLSNRVHQIEYDSNADGRADYVAHHEGRETPRLLDVDTDLDGTFDRWEHYDEAGLLVKVGSSRGGSREDHWVYLDSKGIPLRIEYDADADGRVDRIEVFDAGRMVRVEVDADRDGRFDRWQDWSGGMLSSEELDTDDDGKPDRRLRYGARGEVVAIEPR